MVIIAGESREELLELHKWLHEDGPARRDRSHDQRTGGCGSAGRTSTSATCRPKSSSCSSASLLVVRTQIDNDGAIIAANDSDIMQFCARHVFVHVAARWALVADSLDLAGFPDVARSFYTFCQNVITDDGYFYHKYNPDGSPASSWHPWVMKGNAVAADPGR